MELEDVAAIHLEAIEVIINHILYIRGVYPLQIFKKRRVYNTPVFIVAFPALNCYLANVLKTVKQMLVNQVQELKLEVIIYGDEGDHMESYVLEMLPVVSEDQNQDQYLLEYEEQLRSALYKLAERVKKLPKLSKNSKFKVQIHTTQTAFTHLSHDAQYQEFPWLQTDGNSQLGEESQRFALLPLATVKKVGLKMQAQIFTC
ncbi:mitotic spindle assembly checkpoint protein MAD2B [Drosophila innubila]|uniref:mitotic spindle assembly checkpoint protein MAD2B n=1 Tax=Drosophila innubila TaxID=198719 RepID=UPI00148CFD0D|nr:mitotic spindle assembly checkpoint protein MAD2B [Drosophila innubila]